MSLPSAPRFSIVVISRNEERALPLLLYSIEDFRERGGEVLVVDSGSTDETIAIARARRCRVELVNDRFDSVLASAQAAEINRRFAAEGEAPLVEAGQLLFHFGEARQYAAGLASNPFVFQLDASDQVLAMDIDALDEWIGSGRVDAFEYDQLYGNVLLRIGRFYDRSQYYWEGRVHELMGATVRADGESASRIRCTPSQLLVRHRAASNKTRNYMAGLALQVMESPQRPRWWHYLGRELLYFRFMSRQYPCWKRTPGWKMPGRPSVRRACVLWVSASKRLGVSTRRRRTIVAPSHWMLRAESRCCGWQRLVPDGASSMPQLARLVSRSIFLARMGIRKWRRTTPGSRTVSYIGVYSGWAAETRRGCIGTHSARWRRKRT